MEYKLLCLAFLFQLENTLAVGVASSAAGVTSNIGCLKYTEYNRKKRLGILAVCRQVNRFILALSKPIMSSIL
ncbi:hypothetical protein OPQ81_001933 [Rhizoctonia solani]|nr:hypothetical protein OPQ81_001933 [Rhizoctonia solani]